MLKIKDIRSKLVSKLEGKTPESELSGYYRLILEDLFSYSISQSIMHAEQSLSEMQIDRLDYIIASLENNKPIQQVLGYAHFYEKQFIVDENVLIPRPETEELVHWILQHDLKDKKILDIGTGTACIPISIALNSAANITALDISTKALKIAKQNALKHNVNLVFIQADILDVQSHKNLNNYDVIISNPPYVLESDKQKMLSNVLDYEPHSALFVPDNEALIFYECIAKLATKKLNKSGLLFFEIHEKKGQETVNMLEKLGFQSVELKKDFQNKDRMVKAIWKL